MSCGFFSGIVATIWDRINRHQGKHFVTKHRDDMFEHPNRPVGSNRIRTGFPQSSMTPAQEIAWLREMNELTRSKKNGKDIFWRGIDLDDHDPEKTIRFRMHNLGGWADKRREVQQRNKGACLSCKLGYQGRP